MRFYDFSAETAQLLRDAIRRWLEAGENMLAIHELPFVNASDRTLSFRVNEADAGIIQDSPGHLECRLTRGGYEQMLELMAPFTEGSRGYAWLYDLDTPIELLFSPSGNW